MGPRQRQRRPGDAADDLVEVVGGEAGADVVRYIDCHVATWLPIAPDNGGVLESHQFYEVYFRQASAL